jgi:hypothetical protein
MTSKRRFGPPLWNGAGARMRLGFRV